MSKLPLLIIFATFLWSNRGNLTSFFLLGFMISQAVRFAYSINLYNWELFLVTLASFVIAFGHFLTELLVFHTGIMGSVGMLSPVVVSACKISVLIDWLIDWLFGRSIDWLIVQQSKFLQVSAVSIVLMLLSGRYLWPSTAADLEDSVDLSRFPFSKPPPAQTSMKKPARRDD